MLFLRIQEYENVIQINNATNVQQISQSAINVCLKNNRNVN